MNIERIMSSLEAKHPGELEYLQAVKEVLLSIEDIYSIKESDGIIFGDNTDYYGLKYMILDAKFDLNNAKVLILGNGGASLSAIAVATDLGAKEVIVVSRKGDVNYNNINMHYDANFIINATPVGMYPNNGERLIDLSNFNNCKGVIDLIYNPSLTRLLIDAKKLGIPTLNGLVMLVAQAKKASELFGILNIVFFSPEDLNIIKNGPAERRRFLDSDEKENVEFALDVTNLSAKIKPFVPKADKKGVVALSPTKIKSMKTHAIEERNTENEKIQYLNYGI